AYFNNSKFSENIVTKEQFERDHQRITILKRALDQQLTLYTEDKRIAALILAHKYQEKEILNWALYTAERSLKDYIRYCAYSEEETKFPDLSKVDLAKDILKR
ncbi:13398_t:CDS:2, partial [Racocetra persica]